MSVGVLHWQKGPAIGGGVNLEDDTTLLVVEEGVLRIVRVSGFDGDFMILNHAGIETDSHPGNWKYWARITPQSLPAELK